MFMYNIQPTCDTRFEPFPCFYNYAIMLSAKSIFPGFLYFFRFEFLVSLKNHKSSWCHYLAKKNLNSMFLVFIHLFVKGCHQRISSKEIFMELNMEKSMHILRLTHTYNCKYDLLSMNWICDSTSNKEILIDYWIDGIYISLWSKRNFNHYGTFFRLWVQRTMKNALFKIIQI